MSKKLKITKEQFVEILTYTIAAERARTQAKLDLIVDTLSEVLGDVREAIARMAEAERARLAKLEARISQDVNASPKINTNTNTDTEA